ncbi:hypothetical protein [Delftia lacustris]|jgi:hypothetical protein|uniref:hypothetical protein n=1 Tax=Delftia lacustris TaxID=558537 RepID=UPI0035A6CADC
MRTFQRAQAAFRARRKWQLHELNDWVLAVLGAASFLVAGYWGMAIASVLPGMVSATNQHGLTALGAALFLFLGGMGVGVWFYGCLAKRCNDILFERHFR